MCWRSRKPGITRGQFRRWLHIDEDTIVPSNKQLHLISSEFFYGTHLLRRSASERRREYEAMEGLKTLQHDTSPPAFEIQASQKNQRPSSSGKLLQLTPLWEYVVKNQRIPPEIDKDVLFAELAARLCDLEWEVRGHALRVLVDLIPVMELSELDRYMMPVLLKELTCNLGHSALSVRKGALDTLGVYLNHSADPEKVLRSIIVEGLENQTSSSAVKGNIAMGVILSIPSLVSPLLTPKNGIVLVSQTGLIHLVSALSKKLVQDTYQEQSLKTLVRIREMVGEARFDRFLEGFHPQCKKDFDILCQAYDVRMHLGDSGIDLHVPVTVEDPLFKGTGSNTGHGYWSDGSSPAASPVSISPEDTAFRDQNQNLIFVGDKSSSSENIADSPPCTKDGNTGGINPINKINHLTRTEAENYERDNTFDGEGLMKNDLGRRQTFSETVGIQGIICDRSYPDEEEEEEEKIQVEIEERKVSLLENKEREEEAVTVIEGDALDERALNFSRVVLETEIKFNEDAAIMMTILEEGNMLRREEMNLDETGSVDQDEVTVYTKDTGNGRGDEGYRVYNNNFVMKVLTDDEDYNDDDDVAVPDQPFRRTPRRVRFGGEMVMMRTPDSEETTVDQQDGDRNPPEVSVHSDVSGGYPEGRNGSAERSAGGGAIRAIITDTSRDSTVCTTEILLPDSTRQDAIQCSRDDTLCELKRWSIVEEVGDVAHSTMLEDSGQNSTAFKGEDTVIIETKQDSLDGTGRGSIQDSIERPLRGSAQESKQDSVENVQLGSGGVGMKKSTQDCSDNTSHHSLQASIQDSVVNGKSASVKDGKRESLGDGTYGCVQGTGHDLTENAGQETVVQDAQQRCVENRRNCLVKEARTEVLDYRRRGCVRDFRHDSPESVGHGREQCEKQDPVEETLYGAAGDVGHKQEETRSVQQSHIPLPITPARNKPKDHKRRSSLYRKRQKVLDSETSNDTLQQSSDRAESTRDEQDYGQSVNEARATTTACVGGRECSAENWEELGIVTQSVLDDLYDQEEWVSRIHGIERLSAALKDPEVLQTVVPSMPSLLHCLLITMAEDRNYRVATSSIGAVRGLIASLPHAVLQDHLPQIVAGLTRHIGGAGRVNLKIETVQVAKELMRIMKPNPVVEVLFTSECIGAKSSKMRENSLLFLIYATLTFPSTEFHWDHMAGRVAAAVADPRRRVRQAALDALSVIAQFATPRLLDEAVKVVADRQPTVSTRTAYLAGIQARLARRQLPTTSPDGLILYVLQIPSARTSGKSGLSITPRGSDVDWVLAGSGSLSPGSARSHGQLIAAQRLDPHSTLFPNTEDKSTAPVKKGNPWTERKEIVAFGVGVRAVSAGQKQLAPIDIANPSDEQRPRIGVLSWATDSDANQNGFLSSQGTFHPLYLRFQSPPDISNLNNDSVEKGSFSLLPNRLSQSNLASRGSEGAELEKLNQTWPSPSSGHHSPRIPNTSSKRGRRILQPLNSANPHEGSPQRGVSPARRVSPSCRGLSPGPAAVSSIPVAGSSMPRGLSPMHVGVDSGGRHKIPPLSPHKQKDRVVDSGFSNAANCRNDGAVNSKSARKTRRSKRSTSKGKEMSAEKCNPHPQAEGREELHRTSAHPHAVKDEEETFDHETGTQASTPVISLAPPLNKSSSFKDEAGDDCTIPQKPMLARQGGCHDMSPAGMFPQSANKIPNGLFTPPAEAFLPPVDPSTPPIARTQRSHVLQQQDELEFRSLDGNDEPWKEDAPACAIISPVVSAMNALEAEERAMKFQLLKEHEQLESVTVSPVSVASAPGVIESPLTKTEVIELDTNSRGSFQSLHNFQHSSSLVTHAESAEDMSNIRQAPQATYSTGSIIDLRLNIEDNLQNSMTVAPIRHVRHMKRLVGSKIAASTQKGMHFRENNRTKQKGDLFPDTLHPLDKPKEGLQQSYIQLDSSEWEVTMQGLQLLVRLMRHHPETVHTQLHSVIVAVAKQVRNLRSQVARAACQASGELFLSQKKAVETDLDELASALLHRTADTNRFLRADSNAALDKMIEVVSPSRAVAVIVGKGVSHQNAIVRTASARLLVSLVSKVGVDKVMTQTRDMRDKILLAGSNLLTEGSLDTRCFAKQLFRMLSTHPTFSSVMTEVIPSHILRNISKTLQNLK